MKRSYPGLRVLTVVCATALMVVASTSSASAGVNDVIISHVTVTAGKIHGNSAVVMSITNKSGDPISLISVTSSNAKASMIDYDVNMCQGNHAMTPVANILITGGRTQALGYKYQGAMLRKLKTALVKGSTIQLVITWSDFTKVHSETVEAKVVKAPNHLFFGMAGMAM